MENDTLAGANICTEYMDLVKVTQYCIYIVRNNKPLTQVENIDFVAAEEVLRSALSYPPCEIKSYEKRLHIIRDVHTWNFQVGYIVGDFLNCIPRTR